jgi:hypothetical protein
LHEVHGGLGEAYEGRYLKSKHPAAWRAIQRELDPEGYAADVKREKKEQAKIKQDFLRWDQEARERLKQDHKDWQKAGGEP